MASPGLSSEAGMRSAERISPGRQAERGETETDEGPVDLRPVERADHERFTLAFRAKQDCAAMKGIAPAARRARKMRAGVLDSHFLKRNAVDVGSYAVARPHGRGR